ncbi:Repressor CsoR of the copZA operon [Chitinispirillum alkaliphilum]|nr:Repressor CsoR of the copZA operon [Chitinispirillum alkaliphilum]
MSPGKKEDKFQDRKAHHSDLSKKNLTSRLNRIEGQIRGAKRMIETDTYCDDVLNQLASIQSALSGVSGLLIEYHIKSCVVEQIREGDTEVIDQLMKTIRRMAR